MSKILVKDQETFESAIKFATEEAIANERSIIAEMLKKLEGHFWYPMAKDDMAKIRDRVGL